MIIKKQKNAAVSGHKAKYTNKTIIKIRIENGFFETFYERKENIILI